jgi:hypothetical protein
MVRPRRALIDMQPSSPWARRLVILITVPAVTIAAVFAGAVGLAGCGDDTSTDPPGTGGAPSTSSRQPR